MSSPQPLVFSPSGSWDGNNGNWSTVVVRIGTPEQDFRVLPAPITGEILVPDSEACQMSKGDLPNCGALRGVVNASHSAGFLFNASETWDPLGKFMTNIHCELGYASGATFGTDNVGLMVQNSGGPTLQDQVVGLLGKSPFFTGFFGLSPKAANFTNYNDPHPSYITTLKNTRRIPSLSYGYTAGAFYTPGHAFASLTLGGYDESRFEPNLNITFPFHGDDERPTSIYLQQIMAENTPNGTVSILRDKIFVNLDFTLPFLWLPTDACDRIASLFKLRYDTVHNLYLAEDNVNAELMEKNAQFTFDLGDSVHPAERVSIVIPYSAFNHGLSWPIYNSTTKYFPMRRTNGTHYTLGRAFMQEAYIIVDYERDSFSVHQAPQSISQEQKLVAISAKDQQEIAQSQRERKTLSSASIGGIITACILGTAAFLALAILLFRRRSRSHGTSRMSIDGTYTQNEHEGHGGLDRQLMSTEVVEIQGPVAQMLQARHNAELQETARELPGSGITLNHCGTVFKNEETDGRFELSADREPRGGGR
ncbi:eukaryotic aspartyl protease [Paraphaeosphaeria sporulosa]